MSEAEQRPEPAEGPQEALIAAMPTVWVSHVIAAVLVIGFVASVKLGGVAPFAPDGAELFGSGAMFGPSLADDTQWWRVITTTLLHVGAIHLAMNLFAFWSAGPLTERVYGHAAFAALYVASALGGSFASLAWNPAGLSAGASGAVFGVYGALFVFVSVHRGVIPDEQLARLRGSLLAFFGYNLLFGLAIQQVDLAAHVGGLATGALAGLLFQRDLTRPGAAVLRRAAGAVALVGLLGLAGYGARARVRHEPTIVCMMGLYTDPFAGVAACDEALAGNPDQPTLLAQRAGALFTLGEVERGKADLARILELSPDDPEMLNNVAWREAGAGAWADAVRHADRSLELRPDDLNVLNTRCYARVGAGMRAEGRADCARALELGSDSALDRAMIAYVDGDLEGARRAWQGAVEAHPEWEADLRPWIALTDSER